jgi:hypothetical protein
MIISVMLNPENLLFRLPQTIVRSLGIAEFSKLNFFQGNIAKNPSHRMGTAPDEIAINTLNSEIIFSASDGKTPIILDLFDSTIQVPRNTILDFNLIPFSNLPSMKKLKEPTVIPYASEVYNPILIDLLSPYGILRCLKNSLYIRRTVKPKYFYDWASMICGTNNQNYIPWYWKPITMSLELYLSKVKKVSNSLKKKYNFLNNFLETENPILIQYSEHANNSSIENQLNYLNSSNKIFQEELKKPGARIFIKPHRSRGFIPKHAIFSFKGVEIVYAESLIEHYIPSEIFLNSINKDFLFISEWSSAIYNFQIKKFIPLKSPNIAQIDDLLITSRRLTLQYGFNPNLIFK